MISGKTQKGTNQDRKRVLVVDDQPILRRGLTLLIDEQQDLLVCGSADNMSEAMEAIRESTPDVVTVDLSIQSTNGLDLLKNIKARYPGLPALVLSGHSEAFYAERALRAGAKGYITKYEPTDEVLFAIRRVLNGGLYLSPQMNDKLLSSLLDEGKPRETSSSVGRLTDRELEVFTLLGCGKGTRQIAEQLYVSVKTVETYRLRIKEKLKIDTTPELLQHAFLWVSRHDKPGRT